MIKCLKPLFIATSASVELHSYIQPGIKLKKVFVFENVVKFTLSDGRNWSQLSPLCSLFLMPPKLIQVEESSVSKLLNFLQFGVKIKLDFVTNRLLDAVDMPKQYLHLEAYKQRYLYRKFFSTLMSQDSENINYNIT